jgi:phosphoribosyl 1,2-cyclic phosphodiesterase
MKGPYPDSLKRRITGRGGHLSNSQTAEILREVMTPELKTIVLCHLSDKNNAPHLAESEVLMRIGEEYKGVIFISQQSGPDFKITIGDETLSSEIK